MSEPSAVTSVVRAIGALLSLDLLRCAAWTWGVAPTAAAWGVHSGARDLAGRDRSLGCWGEDISVVISWNGSCVVIFDLASVTWPWMHDERVTSVTVE